MWGTLWGVASLALLQLPTTTPVDPSCPCIWFDGYGHQNNGSFMSPDWPKPYDPDIRCLLYTFVGAANEIVELTFFSLHLGNRDKNGKCGDFLRLFLQVGKDGLDGVNEQSQWEVELCGSQASASDPLRFYSSSSMLVMEFHSDSVHDEQTDRGFLGEFKFLDKRKFVTDGRKIGEPCDYRISSGKDTKKGKIYSPRYPYHYDSNTHCVFYLEGQKDEVIKIWFKTVDLPRVDGSCISATTVVYVFDGQRSYSAASRPRDSLRRLRHSGPRRRSVRPPPTPQPNLIGEYCGRRDAEDLLITSANHATIEFHAIDNKELQGRGFYAEYEFVSRGSGASLPPTLVGPHPSTWPEELFAGGRKCEFDISSSDTLTGGTIHSPNYPDPYPADLKCTYTFRSNSKQRVQIIFKDFDLYLPPTVSDKDPPHKCQGDEDHFTAYVELQGRMSEVDTFCGSETPHQLMSAKTILTAEFVTHFHPEAAEGHTRRGFEFTYKFVENYGIESGVRDPRHVCGFIFNSSMASNGSIYSPNYPGYYPRATDCHYEFHADDQHHVRIFFTYFDVEGYANCDNDSQSDYVLFSNYRTMDRKNQRFCGIRRPGVQESELNFFRMVFHSNSIFDGTGFYALYQFASKTKPAITSLKINKSSLGLPRPPPWPPLLLLLIAVLAPS